MDATDPILNWTSMGYIQRVTRIDLIIGTQWQQILPADSSRWSVQFFTVSAPDAKVFPGGIPLRPDGTADDAGWEIGAPTLMPTITFRDFPASIGLSWWVELVANVGAIVAVENCRLRG